MSNDDAREDGELGRPHADQTEGGPDLRHYLAVLRRRIWAVVTAFVVIVTLATVHAFKALPVYQADAEIVIEKQTPRVMDFQDVVQLEASDRPYYETQAALVRSRAVLEKALEKPAMRELFETDDKSRVTPSVLGEIQRTVSALLGTLPSRPPEPWERLHDAVAVQQVRDTHLLLISATSSDPAHAAMIADAVAQAFCQYHVDRKKDVSLEAFKLLRTQATDQEQKVVEAENAIQQFREQVKIVSLDVADTSSPELSRLSKLSQELTEAQTARMGLEAELKVVEDAIESETANMEQNDRLLSLPEVRADPAVGAIRTSLVEADKEISALSDTYGPSHPQLQAAQAKAKLLRSKLTEALGQVAGSLSPQLAMLKQREQDLHAQYDEQNQLALELAKHSLTYGRLQSEVTRQRKLFDVLVERMREVDLSNDYPKANVEVVQSAGPPSVPIKPKRARIILLSAFLGLLAGIGLAFLFEHMDDTVRTPEDLEERVGVPVLGFVPAMNGMAGGKDGFIHRGMVCAVEPTSSASEAYRNIRTSLFFSAPAERAKALVVTSGGPGDGKTTTATNLALVIAQSGKRVLLVDADLRRPTLHKVFGLESRKGVTTVLVGEATLDEAVQHASNDGKVIENLDVLAAGPKPPNPSELLNSDSMRGLLDEARKKYDRILIDTPPVLFVADASILSAISDGVILVVKSAKNTRSLAGRARDQLRNVKAHVLGGILNEVHVSRLGPYYSDYYYYGYSRYYRDYYNSYYAGKEDAADVKAGERA
jgi:capsular exopolysaccharide synthesis family protein